MKKMREDPCHRSLFYVGLLLIVAASAFFLRQKRSGQPMFFFDRACCGSRQEHAAHYPEKSYILAEKAQGTQVQVGDVIVFLC